MDMPPGNIPPEAMQALQQQQAGGMDITSILAQLSQMSPDEVSQALSQLGINVDPATLQQAASDWVEQAGDKAAGAEGSDADVAPTAAEGEDDGETTPPGQPPSAPSVQDEPEAEDSMAEEQAEGGGGPNDGGAQAQAMAARLPPRGGAGGMPPRGGGRGAGGGIDALISASMGADAGGGPSVPNVPMPRGSGAPAPRMPGPSMPGAGTPGPAQGMPSDMRAMIGSIYRDAAADSRRGAPTGPRPRSGASSAQPRKRSKRNG